MDEQNNDPYEQQLYAVFQSCLVKGQTELHEENWLTLCDKLHLADQSDELRSCIQRHKPEKRSISFQEFRSALLTLLGKSQVSNARTERELAIETTKCTSPTSVDYKKSESSESAANIGTLNVKIGGGALDENKLKCLWERINSCQKENVDSTTMYFVSNCLGIPTLPKQITQCIFEKLDRNCDGLISLDEFLVIFQNRKTLQEQLSLDCNKEALSKSESKKRSFSILSSRKTSNIGKTSNLLDMWKVAGINSSALLSQGGIDLSEICLTDLAATLCDELKNLNDTLDHSTIRSHITLLRDVLILYQEELHRLNLLVENINGEKEKLRTDLAEANERANALAQEIDEQHVRQEEVKQNLRKQIEQRYSETVQDLSNQLASEREINVTALKSKEDQVQNLQKENHEIKNKLIITLKQNQTLETENENLLGHIEKLKKSNNELLSHMKMLAAEHDEVENNEAKQQQEVIYLLDRIKQLQSKVVLLRDQNDELTIELETLRMRDCHVSARDKESLGISTRSIQGDETEEKETMDEESDDDLFFKHSTPMPSTSNVEDCVENCRIPNVKSLKESFVAQLQDILASSNKCTLSNCAFREEISSLINRLQSGVSMHSVRGELEKSIACELETECEERASESLRDFVPTHNNAIFVKRASMTNSSTDLGSDNDETFDSPQIKSASQTKVPSLRDYPPRKEEHSMDSTKANKEKDMKSFDSSGAKISFVKNETVDELAEVNQKLKELETNHATEKKQLTERCSILERSLELLKTEYEECEDYWAAKLEEERQLFDQEQKISDEKLSELIAKMAEYEELISPLDKTKNGRLSPIEEKFNLEQQYLDLEEEFEKLKSQVEEENLEKEKVIKILQEKLESLKRPEMTDNSTEVTEELNVQSSTKSDYVPTCSTVPQSSESSKLNQCMENIRRLTEDYKPFCDMVSRGVKEESVVDHPTHEPRQHSVDNAYKFEKSSHRKKLQIGAKSSLLMMEEDKHEADCDLIQDALRLQELKTGTCQCMREPQKQFCCVDVNLLQNLNMKLQAQERKKHQLQEYYKQQQHYMEHVVHHLISQHQMEVFELQCLLRNTQEKLQMEFQTSAEQAKRLAGADVLLKDLYIENACLTANIKRLEQNYHILTGFNAESTSI